VTQSSLVPPCKIPFGGPARQKTVEMDQKVKGISFVNRREMGGTLVVAESGWGGGFKLSKMTSKKSNLGFNIPFYLLIY